MPKPPTGVQELADLKRLYEAARDKRAQALERVREAQALVDAATKEMDAWAVIARTYYEELLGEDISPPAVRRIREEMLQELIRAPGPVTPSEMSDRLFSRRGLKVSPTVVVVTRDRNPDLFVKLEDGPRGAFDLQPHLRTIRNVRLNTKGGIDE